MIFLALLSTDKKDLPLGVDEEEGWKYELPTIVLSSSGAEDQLHALGCYTTHSSWDQARFEPMRQTEHITLSPRDVKTE